MGIKFNKDGTSSYTPQSKKEIIEQLEKIAEARRDLNLSDHTTAALWNAIEIIEDIEDKEKRNEPKKS